MTKKFARFEIPANSKGQLARPLLVDPAAVVAIIGHVKTVQTTSKTGQRTAVQEANGCWLFVAGTGGGEDPASFHINKTPDEVLEILEEACQEEEESAWEN